MVNYTLLVLMGSILKRTLFRESSAQSQARRKIFAKYISDKILDPQCTKAIKTQQ
jgi:hypothetical protein